jgi:hypothetical protein
VDDLYDLLAGVTDFRTLLPDACSVARSTKSRATGSATSASSKRDADFAHRRADVCFGQRATAAQTVEYAVQPIAQTIEHAFCPSSTPHQTQKRRRAKLAGQRTSSGRPSNSSSNGCGWP